MNEEEKRKWLVKKRIQFWKETAPKVAVDMWFESIMRATTDWNFIVAAEEGDDKQ